MKVNYHNRSFRSVANSANGDVDHTTVFNYRQSGDVVSADYHGGTIRQGTLIATVDSEGCLDMRYAHVTVGGELMTGVCRSRPEILSDGRIRLHERWRWTSGDGSEGESVIEEIDRAGNNPDAEIQ